MVEEEAVCGSPDYSNDGDYGMSLHIGAIFIIFVVSAAGTVLPLTVKKFEAAAESVVMEALFAFSFGVVVATGLIHMINDGVEDLSNECLGSIVENYEALGLAFVLITLVVMHLIECESAIFFMGRVSTLGHAHGHSHATESSAAVVIATPDQQNSSSVLSAGYRKDEAVTTAKHEEDAKRTTRRQIATAMFEIGVIFHSVIIGLDLGVTGGSEFKTLLAAICFHQFFEGIAIGGSALKTTQSRYKLFLMNFTFAVTTPIGIAIGIAIRTTYSSSSVTALWVEGILNCLAGGILLYTGLVELMTYNLTTSEKFLSCSTAQRFAIHLALWLGAGAMALIGKWA